MSRPMETECIKCEYLEKGSKGECVCRGQCKQEDSMESLTVQAFNPFGNEPLELTMSVDAIVREKRR